MCPAPSARCKQQTTESAAAQPPKSLHEAGECKTFPGEKCQNPPLTDSGSMPEPGNSDQDHSQHIAWLPTPTLLPASSDPSSGTATAAPPGTAGTGEGYGAENCAAAKRSS